VPQNGAQRHERNSGFREMEEGMRQKDKGYAFGYVQKQGESACPAPPRPEDVDGTGVAVPVIPDVPAEKLQPEPYGKGTGAKPEGADS